MIDIVDHEMDRSVEIRSGSPANGATSGVPNQASEEKSIGGNLTADQRQADDQQIAQRNLHDQLKSQFEE